MLPRDHQEGHELLWRGLTSKTGLHDRAGIRLRVQILLFGHLHDQFGTGHAG
jgi:hypothetical protein